MNDSKEKSRSLTYYMNKFVKNFVNPCLIQNKGKLGNPSSIFGRVSQVRQSFSVLSEREIICITNQLFLNSWIALISEMIPNITITINPIIFRMITGNSRKSRSLPTFNIVNTNPIKKARKTEIVFSTKRHHLLSY